MSRASYSIKLSNTLNSPSFAKSVVGRTSKLDGAMICLLLYFPLIIRMYEGSGVSLGDVRVFYQIDIQYC